MRGGGGGVSRQLMHHGSAAQTQTILAALDFHFRDAALVKYLKQLFDFLIGHL
jgi:hypothetical protein